MIAVYKCMLCGKRYTQGHTSSVLAETYLRTMLACGETRTELRGYTGQIYRQTVHKCADGGLGVGDIIGFSPEESYGG